MNLKDIQELLEVEVIAGDDLLSEDIVIACGCDLRGVVLSCSASGALLLTGLITTDALNPKLYMGKC